jgi:hypothetical protein
MTADETEIKKMVKQIHDQAAKPLPWWKKLANWVWIHANGDALYGFMGRRQ